MGIEVYGTKQQKGQYRLNSRKETTGSIRELKCVYWENQVTQDHNLWVTRLVQVHPCIDGSALQGSCLFLWLYMSDTPKKTKTKAK